MEEKIVKTQTALSVGERFVNGILSEFQASTGQTMELSPFHRRLAQHLYVKIESQLAALETKRMDRGGQGAPIVWANVNMTKLALDAVHRVELGLDALIPNHISPIPYWNVREKKYDLDLRIGYVGKDCYRRKVALDQPIDIIYELVYSKDKFKPIKKSLANPIESYDFEIVNAFDRGEIIGGFGYVAYEDARKNRLVIVTEKDFQRSMGFAKSDEFWKRNPVEMRYKTLVHRTTDKLTIDPEKIGAAYLAVEMADEEADVRAEVEAEANQGEVIDVTPEQKVIPTTTATAEPPKKNGAPF